MSNGTIAIFKFNCVMNGKDFLIFSQTFCLNMFNFLYLILDISFRYLYPLFKT